MSELKKKIHDWLSEQGYPLEMKVARSFRNAGFRTIQSEYFHDPETETEREVDVVASIDRDVDDLLVRIEFVVECKQSTAKPWLLFTSPREPLAPPARVAQRLGSTVARCVLEQLCQDESAQRSDLFTLSGPPAYGATQALTSGKDSVFGAMASVSSAAISIATEYDDRKNDSFSIAKFVFPLIVVDTKLFGVQLSDDAEEVLISDISEGTVIWRSQRARVPHTIIPVVSAEALNAHIHKLKVASEEFLSNHSAAFLKGRDVAKNRYGKKIPLA